MRPNFPTPPATYVAGFIALVLQAIADRLEACREAGQDVDLSNGERLILRSPDGGRWSLTLDDGGQVSTTRLP